VVNVRNNAEVPDMLHRTIGSATPTRSRARRNSQLHKTTKSKE
jgi:hypothetical protein